MQISGSDHLLLKKLIQQNFSKAVACIEYLVGFLKDSEMN